MQKLSAGSAASPMKASGWAEPISIGNANTLPAIRPRDCTKTPVL